MTGGPLAGAVPAGPLVLPLALETAGLELRSGDVLALCAEVTDNREPGPSGSTRSPVLRLALPSATEILADEVGGRPGAGGDAGGVASQGGRPHA